MKCLLSFIFLFCSCYSSGQSKLKHIGLRPIIGFRLHNNGGEEASQAGPKKVLTTPVVGIQIHQSKWPISLSYQRDFNLQSTSYSPGEVNFWLINETWEEDQLQLYWQFSKFSLGLGHYWKKRENFGHHLSPGVFILKRRGIQLSFVYPTKWLDIEMRTQLQYDPLFAGLVGSSKYSILFLYRIGKTPEKQSIALPFLTVNAIVGTRFFKPDIKLISGEEFNKPFGIAPGIGFEFLVNKLNLSLNIEKDWWLSLNGGSPERDIRSLINNSFLGVRYHTQLKNQRWVRFSVGGSWIEDFENKIKNITPNPTSTQQKLVNFQVKGIGLSISFEILPNTDVEAKTTIPIIGEKPFERWSRTSVGIFYRFNPLRM